MPKTGEKINRSGEYKCNKHNYRVQAKKGFRFPKCPKCGGETTWVLVSPKK